MKTIFFLTIMLPLSALAQSKLTASDGEVKDNFGFSLSVSGNTAVVGAWQNDSLRSNSGAAYVFERGTESNDWQQVTKLIPDDADFAGDEFGKAVAVDGDWLVVGAQFDDRAGKDFGAAYVFERTPDANTPWTQAGRLAATDGAFHDFFGQTVAISGKRVVVGAPEDDDAGQQSGSAYVFERDPGDGSWKQVAKLTASDGEANDHFGSAVAIAGDTVMIGAPEHNHQGVGDTGAVYVFVLNPDDGNWNQTTKLTGNDTDELDLFGHAVALVGHRALIGVPFDDDAENVGGSAYIFENVEGTNTWSQIAKLTSSQPKLGNRFGHSVALAGEQALIGSPGDDDKGKESGAAYLFQYDMGLGSWSQLSKIIPSDGSRDDEFGFTVSLGDDLALISVHEDDEHGKRESGSAYLFHLGF